MKESKRIISIILLIAIAVAIITACIRSEASRQLEAADAVMEENPDSALRILESIDTLSLVKERDLHLRELLLAQARVKLNYDDIDTVPLARAQRFFSAHPEKNYRLRSNFYMGDIAETDSSFIASAGYAADAFLEARDREDSYWLAKSAELISFILGRCEMPSECLKYDSIAIQGYIDADKKLNVIWSKLDFAIDLASSKRYHEADNIMNDLYPGINQYFKNDTALIRYYLANAIDIKLSDKKYIELPILFNIQSRFVPYDNLNARELLSKAKYLIYVDSLNRIDGLLDRAKNILQTDYDRESYQLIRALYGQALSDTLINISANLEMRPILEHLVDKKNANPIVSVLKMKKEHYLSRTIERYNIFFWIILLSVILLAMMIIVLIKRNIDFRKNRERAYEALLNDFQTLENSVSEYKTLLSLRDNSEKDLMSIISQKEISIKEYQDSSKSYYDKYSSELVKHNEEKGKRKKLWRHFYHTTKNVIPIQNIILETLHDLNGMKQNDQNRITDMKRRIIKLLDKDYSEKLYSALCKYNEEILQRLKLQVPGITGSLQKYFVFSASGFSSISISFLFRENEKTIYSTKERLTKKIISSNADDKDLFLQLINQNRKGKEGSEAQFDNSDFIRRNEEIETGDSQI